MRLRKRWVFWLVLGAFLLMGVSPVKASEFSASVITKMGGQEIPGKIFVKGQKVRNESQAGGQTNVMIVRPDKKVAWVILPQEKTYMEMPITEDPQQKMMAMTAKDKANMKLIGTEMVNGFECDKFEATMSHEGQSTKHYAWIAKKLAMPIKMTSADGSFSMEYQDIKPGKVENSLFEPPRGYRKMKMPFPVQSMK